MEESKMRAAVVTDEGTLKIEEVQRPTLTENQVLVHVKLCGVCGGDYHALEKEWKETQRPIIPGHEIVGTIESLPEGETEFEKGETVGVLAGLSTTCGKCKYCLRHEENLCEKGCKSGHMKNGGFAEYVAVDKKLLVKIPTDINLEEITPLFCSGLTAYHGLKISHTNPKDTIAVFGAGNVGLLLTQFAQSLGRHVVVVDRHAEALDRAKQLNPDLTINTESVENVSQEIRKHFGEGAAASFVATDSEKAINESLSCLRKGGVCVALGIPPGDPKINFRSLVTNELQIKGSLLGTKAEFQEALDFVKRKMVHPQVVEKKLEDLPGIFKHVHDRKGEETEGKYVVKLP